MLALRDGAVDFVIEEPKNPPRHVAVRRVPAGRVEVPAGVDLVEAKDIHPPHDIVKGLRGYVCAAGSFGRSGSGDAPPAASRSAYRRLRRRKKSVRYPDQICADALTSRSPGKCSSS